MGNFLFLFVMVVWVDGWVSVGVGLGVFWRVVFPPPEYLRMGPGRGGAWVTEREGGGGGG